MHNNLIATYNGTELQLNKKLLKFIEWKPGDIISITHNDNEDTMTLQHIPNAFVLQENGLIPVSREIADEGDLAENTEFAVSYLEKDDVVMLKVISHI